MEDIDINFDGFHVTHLISDYSGTLYDTNFNPKEKFTDLYKFLVKIRMYLHITIVEWLYTTHALRVFFSIEFESTKDSVPFLKYQTINSRGRCINEEGEVEELLEQLFQEVIKSFSKYKKDLPQLIFNFLEANIHVVAVTDNYIKWGANSLEVIGRNNRFGHKFRTALAVRNCRMYQYIFFTYNHIKHCI